MKKVLFVTGTRADYGKIKSLLKKVESDLNFELYIFVSGMHLVEKLGNTYKEVIKDNYENVYVDYSQANSGIMSFDLGNVISNLTNYVRKIKPDMIVVHGDRIDAMAGAVVGALNNIIVTHIEGGELSGTIDESIRHAISKLSHLHLVSNNDAKERLLQLGEEETRIFVTGSPDIDIMLSDTLPSINDAKKRYGIAFDKYAICMYHPVTTEVHLLKEHISNLVTAMIDSDKNFVVVYPNNDLGSDIIISEYMRLNNNNRFRVFPSLRFEFFLTLLKNADFMIGNSSAGIRETGVYAIPSIDLGTRQRGRFSKDNKNLQHIEENENAILEAISKIDNYRVSSYQFGKGNSTESFMKILNDSRIWNMSIQKVFIDHR
ncbi:UDP-N-acetylglucosamine 2-epimerase [Ruminococcus albus]|uniref:UDP-N-acetylglucosamine 2-epimerase (Hydrolysing) n=1 Tax=Ruminococcus albus TaxID=1264 RepID=A0A1I1RC15_RUMAL|nr:UDP-N-acetylglucosamine 2-epimerase [Ruminococcus albus]SFD31697.1 UDP-N-acetylglucosamine 2-epimerase (hydrolysing) [Ruminococcus albus]